MKRLIKTAGGQKRASASAVDFNSAPALSWVRRSTFIKWLPTTLLCAWTLAIAYLAVWRVWSLGSVAGDLGFLVHALAAVARDGLGAPASWAGWSLLQDHFAPWLLLLSPFAGSPWGGYIVVAAQAAAYGVSVFLVWRLVGRLEISAVAKRFVITGYAFAPALTFPLLFEAHSNVMAAPFVVLLLEGLIFDRSKQAFWAAVAACGFREDVALLVALLAIVFGRERRWAWSRVAIPSALVLVAWRLTSVGGPSVRYSVYYGYLSNIWQADFTRVVEDVVRVLWAQGFILLLVVAIVLPWAFLGRLGIRPLVALVVAGAPYLLADSLIPKSIGFHYWALTPALMVASIVDRRPADISRSRLVLFAGWVITAVVGGPLGFGTLGPGGVTVSSIVTGARDRAAVIELAHHALACIPNKSSASVASELLPLSGHIMTVHLLPHPFAASVGYHGNTELIFEVVNPIWPAWVVSGALPPAARASYQPVEGNPMLWRLQQSAGVAPAPCHR